MKRIKTPDKTWLKAIADTVAAWKTQVRKPVKLPRK